MAVERRPPAPLPPVRRAAAGPPARPARAAPPAGQAARRTAAPGAPLRPLVLWPILLTAAVTLLRLAGELRRWSPDLWSRLPGGGLSPVGITWLVPLVGLWIGWRLRRSGHRPPAAARAAWQPALALLAGGLLAALVERLARPGWTANLLLWGVVALLATAAAYPAWPAAGRALLVYALASRALVAAVMLAAMARGWGTHYDALPPGFPPSPLVPRWLLLGLLPQMTVWIAYTVGVGLVFAALGRAAAARRL